MEQERKLMRTDRVPMRWGEMDALGHMNNVAYFRYFEQARISWFDSLQIAYRPGLEGPILGTITCKFIKPAIYPLELEITTRAGDARRSSFRMWHEMYRADDPSERYAEAEAVMVWIDIADGRSRPLPDWLRKIL
jgi:acyl-CoA thioester hydrolase